MESLASVSKRCKTTAEQEAIGKQFPSFPSVKGQLYRHQAHLKVYVPNPLDVPDELQCTLRGRYLSTDDANYRERFLLYSGQGGRLLIFSADTDLKRLHQSEYLICDGTFEMAPTCSYQLYTIHGYYCGQGMPLVWALLPNKTSATYTEMFGELRRALYDKFGNLGQIKYILTDFELAAIDAAKTIFPGITLKGCIFHFRQAVMRHIANEGLKITYNENNPPEVKTWLRKIMSLSMLPTNFIKQAWEMLKTPPNVTENALVERMQAFSNYFQRTWIDGSFPLDLWSHYDNVGPRTTNLAEGWHNSLNHSLRMPHPSMTNFINWLQQCQNEVNIRALQIDAGNVSKKQKAKYALCDQNIFNSKIRLSIDLGSIYCNIFPHPSYREKVNVVIDNYLSYVAYLIIGNASL